MSPRPAGRAASSQGESVAAAGAGSPLSGRLNWTCTADPASPGYGVYRFRNDRLDLRLSDMNSVDTCPANFGVSLIGTALYDWTPGDNR